MSKGQTTLNGFLYGCKVCETEYLAKKELRSNYCNKCERFETLYIKRNLDMNPVEEEEWTWLIIETTLNVIAQSAN